MSDRSSLLQRETHVFVALDSVKKVGPGGLCFLHFSILGEEKMKDLEPVL